MAIILNDNIQINAGKPIDTRYLSSGNTAYASVGAVNTAISISTRYVGLTVNINGLEYWYKNGVTNTDLILKSITGQTTADAITGATNLGFFSGQTGIQTLPITDLPNINYNGSYNSIYNYYYRGTDALVHTGPPPSDGIPRRGYIKSAFPIKSWIWNEYVGLGSTLGWILVDGDVSQQIGLSPTVYLYYPPSTAYTQTSWTTGFGYNNGSNLVISTVTGSLTTGTTITIGGPPYAKKVNHVLDFRTVISDTPSNLAVGYDESFIHLSGVTPITTGANIGTGVAILKTPVTGTTLLLRRLQGSGSTTVNQVGDSIIITTIVSGSTSGVTNAVNIGTGTGIFKTKVNNCLQFRSLKPSGSTSISQVGDDLVIFSSGGSGGLYNLATPATCTVGGVTAGEQLTGKTALCLLQEILAPELFGTLTAPSEGIGISPSGTFEIGCSISTLCVTGTFNRGSISPQYCSTSGFRSGPANTYCFSGCQIAGSYACTAGSVTKCATSYVVCSGGQTWGVCTAYDAGVQPKGSNGTNYNSPLGASTTGAVSATITGILPWYWGKGASQVLVSADIAGGTKTLANVTASPLSIIFNSAPTDYIWFAVPACAGLKTCWYVNGTNNGCIGGVGNLFAIFCTVAVTSASGCWAGCNYDVYVSCVTTGTAVGVPMCMY
jgi:hypothetical protein